MGSRTICDDRWSVNRIFDGDVANGLSINEVLITA